MEAIPQSNLLNNPTIRGGLEKGVSVFPTSNRDCVLAASHLAETQASAGASCPFLTFWFQQEGRHSQRGPSYHTRQLGAGGWDT